MGPLTTPAIMLRANCISENHYLPTPNPLKCHATVPNRTKAGTSAKFTFQRWMPHQHEGNILKRVLKSIIKRIRGHPFWHHHLKHRFSRSWLAQLEVDGYDLYTGHSDAHSGPANRFWDMLMYSLTLLTFHNPVCARLFTHQSPIWPKSDISPTWWILK